MQWKHELLGRHYHNKTKSSESWHGKHLALCTECLSCLQVLPGWWFQEPGHIFHWDHWSFRAGDCSWCCALFPASRQPFSSSCSCLKAPSSSWRYLKAIVVPAFAACFLFSSELSLRLLSCLSQAGRETEAIQVFQVMFKLNTWRKGKDLPVRDRDWNDKVRAKETEQNVKSKGSYVSNESFIICLWFVQVLFATSFPHSTV